MVMALVIMWFWAYVYLSFNLDQQQMIVSLAVWFSGPPANRVVAPINVPRQVDLLWNFILLYLVIEVIGHWEFVELV